MNEPSETPRAEAPADRENGVGLEASISPDTPAVSGRIGRNTLINVGGAVVPLLISLATVPAYIRLVGEARYGVLAVVWLVLGYFAVFDLGLSRATANQIARMRAEPPLEREQVFWTALGVNGALGAVGGAVLLLVGHILLSHTLKVAPDLRSEAIAALPWLAAAVPLTTLTLVLAGTLEGLERFMAVNLLTITGLALFQLGPLAYAYWVGPQLSGLIMVAVLALFTSTILSFAVTAASLPVSGKPRIDLDRLTALMSYGGWITVTGVVGPILTVFDRIAIGAMLGPTAVTWYTVPFTLVLRVQILSGALARTLFPRFSVLQRDHAAAVGRDSLRTLVAVITPVTVVGAVTLKPFLRAWVGNDLARHSAPIGEILLLGMWLNSLAVIPYAFLQAQGRPDLPAKFHVFEVPPYIGSLLLGLYVAGIRGAAWAWTARAGVDAVLLFAAARKAATDEPADWREISTASVLVTAACVASLTVFDDLLVRVTIGGALITYAVLWGLRVASPQIQPLIRVLRGSAND